MRDKRVTHVGEGEKEEGRERKGERYSKPERESVFILMCTQSEGSVSAIVPGLPVKTARLPRRLFISAPI